MAIIEENWKVIDQIEQKMKEQTGDPEAGFNPTLFFIKERALIINGKYRGKKGKKGQETFTKSHKEISISAKYCPFSGKPLYDDLED